MEIWYVYILESESDHIFYCGMSMNVNQRLHQHNSGKSQFTKGHIPWKLIYFEEVGDRSAARNREKYFKSAAGKRFINKKFGNTKVPRPTG